MTEFFLKYFIPNIYAMKKILYTTSKWNQKNQFRTKSKCIGYNPQSPNKMELKLNQLSASNLVSIFNNAFIEAEIVKNTDFCAIRGEHVLLASALKDQNTIQFQNLNQLPDGMTEEDAKKLVSAVNSQIVVLKAYLMQNSTGDKLSMIFEYNHIVLNNETISPKTIVQIARFVEKAITATYPIYHELFSRA